ncbi:hypothetical protein [Emticicia agri]|uniref:Uncharacterized protein n=1 Tax=Emticicia agri TaxID=2492393 RepID=A0A4Q5M5L6_9BACT|nr:hypothetical protein [Emticicia agri]RYU97449.1 hypothetical protein EWM59_01810 [Emticicia agri]
MRYFFIFLLLTGSKTFAQSTTLLPNATKIGNVSALSTCNSSVRGTQVFNTTNGKMYFCNGTAWVDMTGGGGGGSFSLPYSGSGSSTSPTSLFALTNNGSGRTMDIKNTSTGWALNVESVNNRAINAISEGSYGVYGKSNTNMGVAGISSSGVGIYGYSDTGFSGVFQTRANVGTRLSIGQLTYAQTIARLHIKADGNGGWGQHLRMENGNDTGYGEILHDTDGMKFRNFQANESFIFRNSANSNVFSINSSGNIYADGNAFISGGAGVNGTLSVGGNSFLYGNADISGELTVDAHTIVLNNTASPFIILHETEGYSFSLAANASIISTLSYEAFSGIPTVSVAQVENGTGGWDKILTIPYNVTATSCSIRFTNVSSSAISVSGTWHFTVIGPK